MQKKSMAQKKEIVLLENFLLSGTFWQITSLSSRETFVRKWRNPHQGLDGAPSGADQEDLARVILLEMDNQS